ncbi:MAG: HipA domain-containing protein [Gammaproteobacteria bacterium]|nr:HipA domain-containing protein [Gammaproteobacteria bacterium]
MSERALAATINGRGVGTLREVNGIWEFRYAGTWLADPHRFALCPSLPLSQKPILDQTTHRPVQWYFDNLLPEEGQRTMLAADAGIDAADAFALLAHYGAESAGSLTLLPAGTTTPGEGKLRLLTDGALSGRIRNLPAVPLNHGATKPMSLPGAQHKLPVVLQGGALFEPAGDWPSTHILKPDHPDPDFPQSVINEWFVMRLAALAGLEAPRVEHRYVPEPVYLVERFDRAQVEGEWTRRHAIDACQLLGIDRTFKYSQGSVETLARLAGACRSPAVARAVLFDWLVFNVLVGNADAHLKNLSFLVSHEGIRPAPFYDLLCTAVYESRAFGKDRWPGETRLAWKILGTSRITDITRRQLLEAGNVLGLAKTTATRRLERLQDLTRPMADRLVAQVEEENARLIKRRPELAATLGGELRCVRAIRHTVLEDMAQRLT